MWVARSMSVPSVSVIVAMSRLMAALEHFLHPLRRNQERDSTCLLAAQGGN